LRILGIIIRVDRNLFPIFFVDLRGCMWTILQEPGLWEGDGKMAKRRGRMHSQEYYLSLHPKPFSFTIDDSSS